jgi:hypothetical protein
MEALSQVLENELASFGAAHMEKVSVLPVEAFHEALESRVMFHRDREGVRQYETTVLCAVNDGGVESGGR